MSQQKLSSSEKAVQKKVERGQRLNSDDRRIVQARLRGVQKRNQYNGATAIPSNTLTKNVGLNAQAVKSSVQSTARGLNAEKCPTNFSRLNGAIETCRTSLSQGGGGSFSEEFENDNGLNTKWTVSGSITMADCQALSDGSAGGGAQSTGGGTNTANAGGGQSGSGWGVSGNAGAGGGQSAGVSVPVSGATVSGGTGQAASGGVGAGYSSNQSQSAGNSNGMSTGGGTANSGAMLRQSYSAKLHAQYTVTFEPAGGWQDFWGQSSGSTDGECEAGEVTFTIEEAP